MGDARAARLIPALDRLEQLAFASQLGRSAASVALGFLAARLGVEWLRPLFGDAPSVVVGGLRLGSPHAVSIIIAMGAVALLHAILGQQVPKIFAVQRAEWFASNVALRPMLALAVLLSPLIHILGWVVRSILRLVGVRSTGFEPLAQTPEEIRMLVTHGPHGSEPTKIEDEEREMLRGVFEFAETVAREVMTPRTEMVAVSVDIPLDELVGVVTTEGHSRIPVYEGSIDSIVGVLLTKDLLPVLRSRLHSVEAPFDIRTIMREPYFVPDTKPVNSLLGEFRQHSVHLAIVLDEFGGTYGLVTMEDLLEEIVGDINDEFDVAEPEFEPTPEGDVLIDGSVAISEVNDRFGLCLPEEDYDTLGGYIFGAVGRVPTIGDSVQVEGPEGALELRVEELEERRVACIRLTRLAVPEATAAE